MKYSAAGILSSIAIALLPFATSGGIFYPDVNSKFFFVGIWTFVLLCVGAYTLYKNKHPLNLKGQWLLIAFGILLAIQYLSAFSGIFPERSLWSDIFWSSGVLFLTTIGFLAVLLGKLLTERDWSLIRRAVAFSAGLFSILLIIGQRGFGYTFDFLWVHLNQGSLTLGNETYAGVYLLLALILGFIELSRTTKGTLKTALIISIVVTALSPILINTGLLLGTTPLSKLLSDPAEILGFARASSATMLILLGFFAGHFILRRVLPKKLTTRATLFLGGGIVGAAVAILFMLFTPGSMVQQAYIEESSAARPIVWDAGVEAFKERPFLGWGPENFNYAFQNHFDNRLFLDENIGEIWFDRAHNVFIDTLVGVGVVGLAAFGLLTLVFLITVLRARKKELISDTETILLCALVPAHLLQLQTGFDTVSSYTLLAVILGYGFWLEGQMLSKNHTRQNGEVMGQKVVAVLLVLVALVGGKYFLGDEYERQTALWNTMAAKSAAEQQIFIATSLSRVSSFESLRLSSSSFIKGALESIAENPSPELTKLVLSFLTVYEGHYIQHLEVMPDDYRARLNYAYLLLIKTTLGDNRLVDAKELIRGSYELSPGNPLTYILDSTAELYGGSRAEADRLMQEALAINPNIPLTQEAAAYLEQQKKLFPKITVLKLTNL